jgi:acyl dehydratase
MEHRSRSLYFEDFQVDDKFYTQSRTITEADIMAFAGVSGDFNLIHTDKEFAADSIHGERIAHGLLGLAVVSGLAARMGFAEDTAIALRKIDWKFSSPVFLGDSIKAILTVTTTKSIPGDVGGIVDFLIDVYNQNGTKIQAGTWRLIIKTRDSSKS